ncbi:phage tail protein, partial [Endozoicomonas sp. SM1973]
MQNYFVLLTKVGQARLSEVIAAGEQLNMSHIKLGDGGEDEGKETDPKETDTQLKRDRAEVPINEAFQHESNGNWIVFQAIIPDEIGGFYITELGLYDDQDNLIAIGKYPKTYKSKLPDGIATSMTLDVICQVG